jgi:hypothetical protein
MKVSITYQMGVAEGEVVSLRKHATIKIKV